MLSAAEILGSPDGGETCEVKGVEVAGEESVVRTVALAKSLISQASVHTYWL